MADVFPQGKIDRNSSAFLRFERIVLQKLKKITEAPVQGIWSKLKRRVRFNRLNLQLALYGWQIKWNGTFIEVPVFDNTGKSKPIEQVKPKPLSTEYYSDLARNHFIETGKLINPHTGQPISNAERYRYFS